MEPEVAAKAISIALRELMEDEELVKKFWHTGYVELTGHAEGNASRWIGRRILTAGILAITTWGLVWLVKSGALK